MMPPRLASLARSAGVLFNTGLKIDSPIAKSIMTTDSDSTAFVAGIAAIADPNSSKLPINPYFRPVRLLTGPANGVTNVRTPP